MMSSEQQTVPGRDSVLLEAALGVPGARNALANMRKLRLSKMDKSSVVIVSAQKAGSTLLCYLCALVNTKNGIKDFRNDFDILPMLSFPTHLIAQNFNARQDGVYQMYKINGTLRQLQDAIDATGFKRIVWSCREFEGYYKSVYWWVREFYPRIGVDSLATVGWQQFQEQTFRQLAEDHIAELRYVYDRTRDRAAHNLLTLSYEFTTRRKHEAIGILARWLGIELDADATAAIAQKTTKEAMAEGDRFDPIAYGDGNGLNKVNLSPHQTELAAEHRSVYQDLFRAAFRDTPFTTYRELADALCERHLRQT